MYRLHLSSAFGFYNHLLLRMQIDFHSVLNLDGFLDFTIINYQKNSSSSSATGGGGNNDMLKDTLTRIVHKFLICLGDLARYLIEYDPYACPKLAYKYYQMTLILLPSNGTPLNQLGTLFGGDNYGCDATYYYLYSLSCTDPFLSARENLKLLFLKNRKRFEETSSSKYLDRNKLSAYTLNELRTKEIKKFLVTFLHINDCMLANTLLGQSAVPPPSGKSLTDSYSLVPIDNQQLQELCQVCLQEFNSVMFYRKPEAATTTANELPSLERSSSTGSCSSSSSLAYLSDELVFKLTVIILMTIEQLKTRRTFLNNTNANSSKQTHHSRLFYTSVAFAHVFFSHIVNHTIIRLQEALLSMRTKNKSASSPLEDESTANVTKPTEEDESGKISSDDSNSDEDDDDPRKKKVKLLFGHRRRKHNSDSDTNESNDDERSAAYDEHGTDSDDNDDDKLRRRKNENFCLERENLSETELNMLSDEEEAVSPKKRDDSSNSSETGKFPAKLPPGPTEYGGASAPIQNFASDSLFQTYPAASINFKEFSSQLFTTLNSQFYPGISGLPGVNSMPTTEEFIDDELYKFVLNGKNNPALNMLGLNAKEVQEIEELGKKLETFEFDTDTDMSLFDGNSDEEEEGAAAKQQPQTGLSKSRGSSSDAKASARAESKQPKQSPRSSSKKSQM